MSLWGRQEASSPQDDETPLTHVVSGVLLVTWPAPIHPKVWRSKATRTKLGAMKRLAIMLAIVGTVACRQTTEPPGEVTVTLEASHVTAQRGDTVTFTVNAAGNNLFGVVVEFGDASVDQYATNGALTARVTFKHAYDAAGTFTVRAIVTDAIAGEREATKSIVVN